jgi:hypothetical protein
MEEKPASWKKLSAVSQASANPGSMGVKMHRSYHLNDEDETEVDMDDIAKGSQSVRVVKMEAAVATVINCGIGMCKYACSFKTVIINVKIWHECVLSENIYMLKAETISIFNKQE